MEYPVWRAAETLDYRRLFHEHHTPYMILDKELRFLVVNDQYLQVTQRNREDLIGHYVFDVFPETGDRLAMFKMAFERAVAGEANSIIKKPFSIPRPEAEGGGLREVWWTCHHTPVYGTDGIVVGMFQHAEDVTAQVEAEQIRNVIASEFSHRIKNLLSTTLSIANRTAKSATSVEDFIGLFSARLQSMARVHDFLANGGWKGTSLGNLITSELEPFRDIDGQSIVVSGPEVVLTAAQAETLGLMFHELATNAGKYGALSKSGTKLKVEWTMDERSGQIKIVWCEDGMADLQPPIAAGFGSLIIEQVVPMRLSASVVRQFLPTGLSCTIALPLSQ